MDSSTSTGIVRRADLGDLAEISRLADQLGYPNQTEDMRQRLAVVLENPAQAVFVVDLPEKKTAGYIHVVKDTFLEVGPLVEVGGLVIDQNCRRRGLGKILLTAAEKWAKEMGCRQIRLHSNIIRKEAHRFYQDMGFSIVKTQYSFVKTLGD